MSHDEAERWRRAKRLLALALELPRADQPPFVAEACATDPSLRSYIESLLEHASRQDLLEDLAVWTEAKAVDRRFENFEGTTIGPWLVGEQINRSLSRSTHAVTRGDRGSPREGIIHVLRTRLDDEAAGGLRRRAATMPAARRSGIARVIEADATEDGIGYVVMEGTQGDPLDVYCDVRRLPIHARVELFCGACAVLEGLHEENMAHGSLEPASFIVGKRAAVSVVDLGVAPLLTPETQARAGANAGFDPQNPFASPEMRTGKPATVVSDVFSMGGVLYWLLSGRCPNSPAGSLEARAADSTPGPAPPSVAVARTDERRHLSPGVEVATVDGVTKLVTSATSSSYLRSAEPEGLRSLLEGGLDAAVLKAMAARPTERFSTVGLFVAALVAATQTPSSSSGTQMPNSS